MSRETAEAYLMGAVGLTAGLWEHYKPEMMLGGLVVSAFAYDLMCEPGGTISEAVDKITEKHPIATRFAILYTSLHLLRWLPGELDAYTQTFKAIKGRHE